MEQREKYIRAWNDTMVRIWRERITLLGVFRTGQLYSSVQNTPVRADGRFYNVSFSFSFMEYGVFQDRGTNRRYRRGNSGDTGHAEYAAKRPRRWFSRPWYSSTENLKDFLADDAGQQFVAMVKQISN